MVEDALNQLSTLGTNGSKIAQYVALLHYKNHNKGDGSEDKQKDRK